MPNRLTILYVLAWVSYVLFSYTMFPVLKISAGIPVFFLVGTGAWLYGTTTALGIIAVIAVYHTILLSFIYAAQFDMYQTKVSSTLLLITIAYLGGHFRTTYEKLRATHEHLDRLVTERTDQLNALTEKLLDDSELLKITKGQELHDGMGQQLTGIQLLSASLSEQLLDESNTISSMARHMKIKASRVHHQIRRISRLLFPVRIGQVGLIPALNELAASVAEIKPVTMQVVEHEELSPIPEPISLQLYRICQETALYTIDHLNADRSTIEISESSEIYRIQIEHNGSSNQTDEDRGPFNLIEYRLNQVAGKMTASAVKRGIVRIEISVPKQDPAIGKAV